MTSKWSLKRLLKSPLKWCRPAWLPAPAATRSWTISFPDTAGRRTEPESLWKWNRRWTGRSRTCRASCRRRSELRRSSKTFPFWKHILISSFQIEKNVKWLFTAIQQLQLSVCRLNVLYWRNGRFIKKTARLKSMTKPILRFLIKCQVKYTCISGMKERTVGEGGRGV